MKNLDNTRKSAWTWPVEMDLGKQIDSFCRDVLRKETQVRIVGDGSRTVLREKRQKALAECPVVILELQGPISGEDFGEQFAVFKLDDVFQASLQEIESQMTTRHEDVSYVQRSSSAMARALREWSLRFEDLANRQ